MKTPLSDVTREENGSSCGRWHSRQPSDGSGRTTDVWSSQRRDPAYRKPHLSALPMTIHVARSHMLCCERNGAILGFACDRALNKQYRKAHDLTGVILLNACDETRKSAYVPDGKSPSAASSFRSCSKNRSKGDADKAEATAAAVQFSSLPAPTSFPALVTKWVSLPRVQLPAVSVDRWATRLAAHLL